MFIFLLTLQFLAIQLSYSLDGPHVCQQQTKQLQKENIPTKLPFEVKTFRWCPEIPPRCQTTRIEYRDSFTVKIKDVMVNVSVCCPGYAEYNDRCIPVCSDQCVHGICVAPNTCDCEAGWFGDICNNSCPDGRSGSNCSSLCNCKNDAICNSVTGSCDCKPGWTGIDCSKPCPKNWFGGDCMMKCDCLNEGACNHITGECICRAGFKGKHCQDECSNNELDPECNWQCFCNNNGYCNPFTASCECQSGYTGRHCEYACPPGFYGFGCSKRCNCPESECNNELGCPIIFQSASTYRDEGSNAANPILLIFCCALLFIVCLVLLALLKYRRRVKDMSKERAYVTYVANKEASDQFENPVYSFDNSIESKLRPLSVYKSNNLTTLTNDLSLSNNKWDKYSFPELGTNSPLHPYHNNFQSRHSHQPHHSHRQTSFDLGARCSSHCRLNICDQASNLYVNQELSKSSDSLFKEPIYAEIKSRDFEDDRIDHYDRPRPINKILNNDSNI